MSPTLILSIISIYFLVLILISYFTGKSDSNDAFFLGNKQSPWYIVSFGMIGATLSGVTFISVPGWVADSQFSYMQMILGMTAGYIVIANVLMPIYYRMNLTSIYAYLGDRFGESTHQTGAFFFLLSRTIGASFRLYLVANVMQIAIFDAWNVPFWLTVSLTIILIWIYTFRSGIKTIIWTDTLQTLFMLLAVGVSIGLISDKMGLGLVELSHTIRESQYSQVSFWEGKQHFLKQFLSGAFLAIVMTGLDQDMMQKNLSIRTLKEAQWNMLSTSAIVVLVNVVFLTLGLVMIAFLQEKGIIQNGVSSIASDLYFPTIALEYLGGVAGMAFVLGLAAATFSSADSVLTTLTTSTYFDVFRFQDKGLSDRQLKSRRIALHSTFAVLLLFSILGFNQFSEGPVIDIVLGLANYTYGPLIGLFALGVFTRRKPSGGKVIIVSILAPLLSWGIGQYTYVLDLLGFETLNLTYQFGYELILINGILSFLGLFVGSKVSQGL